MTPSVPNPKVKRVHIIGRKNHGKTTLVVDLVRELRRREVRVATIKHTHHEHELDTPGKDSHKHRTAGAAAVGIVSRGMSAVFWEDTTEHDDDRQYARFESILSACDLILVEGDAHAQAPKIEVWRAACKTEPLANDDPTIRAVITNDPINVAAKVLARSDISLIADWITQL